jgi:hypothetical protein
MSPGGKEVAMVRPAEEDGILGEKVRQLEARAEKWDYAIAELLANTAATSKSLARIEGTLEGALQAKAAANQSRNVVVSVAASAIVGLLLWALSHVKAGG